MFNDTPLMCGTIRDSETGIELKFEPEIPIAEAMLKLQWEVQQHWGRTQVSMIQAEKDHAG